MTVAVLLITHNQIGQELLHNALVNLGRENPGVESIQVNFDADPDKVLVQCQKLVKEINHGDGVLVLTDLFGSTPSNIAHKLLNVPNTQVITGINLSMVMKAINYCNEPIDDLVDRIVKGGKDAILSSRSTTDS